MCLEYGTGTVEDVEVWFHVLPEGATTWPSTSPSRAPTPAPTTSPSEKWGSPLFPGSALVDSAAATQLNKWIAVDGATPFPEGTPFDSSWMSAAEPEGSGTQSKALARLSERRARRNSARAQPRAHQRLAAVATPQPVADSDGGNANFV